jgi:sortase A
MASSTSSTSSASSAPAAPEAAPSRRRGNRVLQGVGWVQVGAGLLVLLYVVYALFYTGLETDRAQTALFAEWQTEIGPPEIPDAPAHLVPDPPAAADEASDEASDETSHTRPEVGDAVAIVAFERPGAENRPVIDDYLVVVAGVGATELRAGPGHYPESSLPGHDGNFAVAGHRVTYAAPFHRLDELREDDRIHVWDRSGRHHVYRFTRTDIVRPDENWVLGPDPLETGEPTITLTTCHPRYSNRERMIAFGELET